jgi:uncharacterized protein YbaA (DUF1428 family)
VVLPTSNSNASEKEEEIGNHIVLFIYRLPKKNHEALVQLGKQANEMFKKVGVIRSEVFQLSNTQDMMGFTNISKTVSANKDEEEVVLETQTYRDQKHLSEVGVIMEKDKNAGLLYQQFMSLIIPGSCIFGEFGRIKV